MTLYKEAGVDIDVGNRFVTSLPSIIKKTRRKEVLADIGGFAGLFALQKYTEPVLVASTDGVGTKILLANAHQKWRGVGIDCVAMCVNDIACYGAEPLFFLDYLAASRLNTDVLKEVVGGMADACQEVGCALLGGETAEMPGVYPEGEWDCAGFALGVVEKKEIMDGRNIEAGDAVIGVASSGFHSNGFSLIRKILAEQTLNLQMRCSETGLSLLETLLYPTRLYTPLILALKKKIALKGIAHITGGGLVENPPRMLPEDRRIVINYGSWPVPEYMSIFKKAGALSDGEFYRVFNAGIGLVLAVSAKEKKSCLEQIAARGDKAWEIGKID